MQLQTLALIWVAIGGDITISGEDETNWFPLTLPLGSAGPVPSAAVPAQGTGIYLAAFYGRLSTESSCLAQNCCPAEKAVAGCGSAIAWSQGPAPAGPNDSK